MVSVGMERCAISGNILLVKGRTEGGFEPPLLKNSSSQEKHDRMTTMTDRLYRLLGPREVRRIREERVITYSSACAYSVLMGDQTLPLRYFRSPVLRFR